MNNSMHVAVIGAGAIGVSIAASLAERGVRVSLVDEQTPGRGTSGATFGWLNSNGKEPYSYFDINRRGLEAHYRLAEGGGSWLGTSGHIEIAADPQHCVDLADRVERLDSRGYPAEFVSRDTASRLTPGIRIPVDAELIAHFPRETFVYPSLYIAHALHRARAAGARLLLGHAVTSLESAPGGRATVGLADGTVIEADIVVSAVGRWTAELAMLADVEAPIQQYGSPGDVTVGYLLQTEPVPVLLDRIVTTPWLNLRPEGGGRLLLQALDLDESADPSTIPSISSELSDTYLDRLRSVTIGGEFARIERFTVGRRAIPSDGHTIAGRVTEAPWLYMVATHSGMTLAPFLGEAVADEVGGKERPELANFRLDRFTNGTAMITTASAPRRPGQQ